MNRARTLLLAALAGCQPLTPPVVDTAERDAITALDARVEALSESVAGVEAQLADTAAQNDAFAAELTEQNKALGRVESALVTLPDMLKDACPPLPAPAAQDCPAGSQRIAVSGDKMVVGLREYVQVSPPGAQLVARIDTSLLGNSLYVSDVVEYERDGDNWVRFKLAVPGDAAPREVERPLRRRVKTDAEPSAPRVIQLRVSLGDVTDTYDVMLVEGNMKDHQLRLGRNFLRDTALVDVARRFVQPPHTVPAKPAS